MIDEKFMANLLDSLKDPILAADTNHKIIYMNKAAIEHFDDGEALLGRSLLNCHNERSRGTIIDILAAMRRGEDERLITDTDEHRIYMRVVRDEAGEVKGYYERYEPPEK